MVTCAPGEGNRSHARAARQRVLVLLLLLVAGWGCAGSQIENRLIIIHAGSLTVPLRSIARQYERENEGVRVLLEPAGSLAGARKITDLKQEADVYLSADYAIIDHYLGPEYAKWHIKFATNEMVIAYNELARASDHISAQNWIDILLGDAVAYGRSDPNSDPSGYRTILAFKLAEAYYGRPGITSTLSEKDSEHIRPKSVELLALLETGAIDYAFLYRSVAQQHGLEYLVLPPEINLKDADLADLYASVSVKLPGKTPGQTRTLHGEPIVFGLTIPSNAPNPELAVSFVAHFLDSERGLATLDELGQPPMKPSSAYGYPNIPDELKMIVRKE